MKSQIIGIKIQFIPLSHQTVVVKQLSVASSVQFAVKHAKRLKLKRYLRQKHFRAPLKERMETFRRKGSWDTAGTQ